MFEPVPLTPTTGGPLLAERSRIGMARTWRQLEDLLSLGHGVLAGCWKWASTRGAAPEELALDVIVDPFGQATSLTVTRAADTNEELARCLEDAFTGIVLARIAPRTSRMHANVRFQLAAQPPWPAVPLRPTLYARRRDRACVPVLDGPATDQVASPVTFVVDDSDDSRLPVPAGSVPVVYLGCDRVRLDADAKADYRRAYASNEGAFRRCYAAATDRDPDVSGTLHTSAVFTPAGVLRVTLWGAGDVALHRCVESAIRELWVLPLPDGPVQVDWTFQLEPRREAGPAPGNGPCAARIAQLRARVREAPWLDDELVLAAARELATFAASLPDAAGRTCLAGIEDLLVEIAIPQRHEDDDGSAWLHRVEAVMPAAHLLAAGSRLRWAHAQQLLVADGRYDEGIAELRALATDPIDGQRARQQLASLHPTQQLRRKCAPP